MNGGDVATGAEKVRENRLRRAAERQGYRLVKSRRRDPMALDFGRWFLDELDDPSMTIEPDGLTLDQVEAWLRGER
jgi:hypothetical protein